MFDYLDMIAYAGTELYQKKNDRLNMLFNFWKLLSKIQITSIEVQLIPKTEKYLNGLGCFQMKNHMKQSLCFKATKLSNKLCQRLNGVDQASLL